MAHDDNITLGGQTFPIKGFVRGNSVSEFETGIKIGKATYDSREHAFFLVLDDFSGGFGHRRLDIREELGTFWESLKTNAPDLRRPGHITLPTVMTARAVSANPTAIDLSVTAGDYPWCRLADNSYVFGIGNSIYRTTDGVTYTRVDAGGADAGGVGSIVQMIGRDASVRYFAFYWSQTAALTGTARYKISTDGITWANGAIDRVLHHGFYWDDKLIAAYGRSIIFATLTAGVEAWNFDDVNDAEFIANVAADHITFVGVATAPWGEPAIYFQNAGSLWVLDFFARKCYPVDLGIGRFIHSAILWGGQIVVSDGWNCWLYNPGDPGTVRPIGFPRLNGIPPEMRDSDGQALTRFLSTSDAFLYAAVSKPAAAAERRCYLFVYNGVGWSQIGGEMTNFEPSGIFQGNYRSFGLVSDRKMTILGAQAYNNTTAKVTTYQLPELHQVPTVDIDSFGPSGARWTTGWIDGGFNDIDGTLLRLNIDAWNLSTTETVRVEYQLDNNEASAWAQMVDSNNLADLFDNTTNILYFSQTTPKRGIKFRTVRFRITINRGGTPTKSPEIRALTLVFLKTPEFRSAWTLQIDANRMIETSATGNDTTYYIDGNAATMARIWSKLQSLWINNHTLVELIIPNIEPSPGINVKITDVPMTFDDFRNAVDGQGYIDVQVLEPVSR